MEAFISGFPSNYRQLAPRPQTIKTWSGATLINIACSNTTYDLTEITGFKLSKREIFCYN